MGDLHGRGFCAFYWTMENFNDLTEMFVGIVNTALARGFEFPIRVVAMAVNGSVLAIEYQGEGRCESLCENFRDGMFRLPINLYLSDATNKASLVAIQTDATPKWMH
jgi:hypothetical protein